MTPGRILVVGGGVAGTAIADALSLAGADVVRIDAGRPQAGSTPSAGLMKPGWISGIPRWREGLDKLGELYGLRTIPFRLLPGGGLVDVHRAVVRSATRAVLPYLVRSVRKTDRGWLAEVTEPVEVPGGPPSLAEGVVEASTVVLAAGYWTDEILRASPEAGGELGLRPRAGVAFRFRRHLSLAPTIRPWAPYKQVVAFQEDDETAWAGDGTAVKPSNLDEDRVEASRARIERTLPSLAAATSVEVLRGVRPYLRGGGVFEERKPGLYVATGGSKNGTALAGVWAVRAVEELR